MKVLLTMPNVQIVLGSGKGLPLAERLHELGFTFRSRPVPNGTLLSAAEPVTIELDTIEELVELQRSIGLPICVEDGILEIRSA